MAKRDLDKLKLLRDKGVERPKLLGVTSGPV